MREKQRKEYLAGKARGNSQVQENGLVARANGGQTGVSQSSRVEQCINTEEYEEPGGEQAASSKIDKEEFFCGTGIVKAEEITIRQSEEQKEKEMEKRNIDFSERCQRYLAAAKERKKAEEGFDSSKERPNRQRGNGSNLRKGKEPSGIE